MQDATTDLGVDKGHGETQLSGVLILHLQVIKERITTPHAN